MNTVCHKSHIAHTSLLFADLPHRLAARVDDGKPQHQRPWCAAGQVTLGVGLLDGLMLVAGYGLAQWLVIERLH